MKDCAACSSPRCEGKRTRSARNATCRAKQSSTALKMAASAIRSGMIFRFPVNGVSYLICHFPNIQETVRLKPWPNPGSSWQAGAELAFASTMPAKMRGRDRGQMLVTEGTLPDEVTDLASGYRRVAAGKIINSVTWM